MLVDVLRQCTLPPCQTSHKNEHKILAGVSKDMALIEPNILKYLERVEERQAKEVLRPTFIASSTTAG